MTLLACDAMGRSRWTLTRHIIFSSRFDPTQVAFVERESRSSRNRSPVVDALFVSQVKHMDAVQSLLSSMEAPAAAGEANCPNTSTTSDEQMHRAISEGRTTAIRSTKLVFVYSDEDEGPSGVVQTTAEQVLHPDTLAELQADAAEMQRQEAEAETAKREAEAMPAFSGFTEDLVGEVASVTAAATTAAVELYGPGVRVVARMHWAFPGVLG